MKMRLSGPRHNGSSTRRDSMAINTVNQSDTTAAANTTSVPTARSSKKKSALKNSTASLPGSRTAGKPGPTPGASEIVFKELPNPYRPPVPPFIWIDYPISNERLQAPMYAIRLGVGGAEHVAISIDQGPWQNCRLTSGFWWYDWSGITTGKHTLVARMRTQDGRIFRTPPRTCEYRP